MKIILLEDVKSVGKKGELVELKEGYAKNFILPTIILFYFSKHTH